MIRNRDHPPARPEPRRPMFEQCHEAFNFAVDRDPQSLESTRGRVDSSTPATPNRTLHHPAQFTCSRDRPAPARLHDSSRNPPRGMLLTQLMEQPRQLLLRLLVNQATRTQRLPLIHPHVEWTIMLKTETSLAVVQGEAAHAEIR